MGRSGLKPTDPVRRFWSKVERHSDTECWLYVGAVFTDGYGAFQVGGKCVRAHRYAYRIAKGEIRTGMVVMHSCDVRTCCNPAHLSLGTPADNSADMVRKGRQAKGERNSARLHPERLRRGEGIALARLTAEQVQAIRNQYVPRQTPRYVLAEHFGVTKSTIDSVLAGKTWTHV